MQSLLSTIQKLPTSSLSPPEQAALMLDARAHLKHCHSPRNDIVLPSPWQESIPEVDLAVMSSMRPSAGTAMMRGPPLEAFTDLNPYLRHVVLRNTLFCHALVLQSKGKSTAEVEEKAASAGRKTMKKLEACKAGPETKMLLMSLAHA
ncbi:hypothetical protein JCM11251_003511 [Rhodosporidiobolus azoricus]